MQLVPIKQVFCCLINRPNQKGMSPFWYWNLKEQTTALPRLALSYFKFVGIGYLGPSLG